MFTISDASETRDRMSETAWGFPETGKHLINIDGYYNGS